MKYRAAKAKFASEADLAKVVIDWLQQDGWTVYQEVLSSTNSRRADIVAVRGPILWAIETKLCFSFDLAEQACGWLGHAHWVSVATPTIDARFVTQLLLKNCGGIGWLKVDPKHKSVGIAAQPKLYRRITNSLRKSLTEESKTFAAAGNNRGLFFSPFRQTCQALEEQAEKSPGICLRDALMKIKHHYAHNASAHACLSKLILGGVLAGVRIERDGKRLLLYPVPKNERKAA